MDHAAADMTATTSADLPPAPATAPWGRLRLRRWLPLLMALAFAAVVTALPVDAFKDRQNYLNYFTSAPLLLLTEFEAGLGSLLANEPVFVSLCLVLNALMEPEQALRVVIFAGAFLVAHASLRLSRGHLLLVLCFLLCPQILKNHIVHLRQGLGIGVFLVGWTSSRPRVRWTFMLLAPFVHSSFVFVLLMMAVGAVVRKFGNSKMLAFGAYLALGLAIGFGLGIISQLLGARQGEQFEFVADPSISGQGFAFWTLPLAVMLMQSRRFVSEHLLEIGSIIVYLATYFLSPVTGRVFESSLILVLLAGLRMRADSRLVFLGLIGAYTLLQWLQIAYGINLVFGPDDI
jgi:hypothetical protein